MCKLVTIRTNFGTKVDVADIKKGCIENIVNQANQCEHIDYIILFGSSLEETCQEVSDIDIAIISNVTRSRLFALASYDKFVTEIYLKQQEQDYDILQFNSMEQLKQKKDAVCRDIVDKGKIIYMRGGAQCMKNI